MGIYIYIYIYVCVCVSMYIYMCVCGDLQLLSSLFMDDAVIGVAFATAQESGGHEGGWEHGGGRRGLLASSEAEILKDFLLCEHRRRNALVESTATHFTFHLTQLVFARDDVRRVPASLRHWEREARASRVLSSWRAENLHTILTNGDCDFHERLVSALAAENSRRVSVHREACRALERIELL